MYVCEGIAGSVGCITCSRWFTDFSCPTVVNLFWSYNGTILKYVFSTQLRNIWSKLYFCYTHNVVKKPILELQIRHSRIFLRSIECVSRVSGSSAQLDLHEPMERTMFSRADNRTSGIVLNWSLCWPVISSADWNGVDEGDVALVGAGRWIGPRKGLFELASSSGCRLARQAKAERALWLAGYTTQIKRVWLARFWIWKPPALDVLMNSRWRRSYPSPYLRSDGKLFATSITFVDLLPKTPPSCTFNPKNSKRSAPRPCPSGLIARWPLNYFLDCPSTSIYHFVQWMPPK